METPSHVPVSSWELDDLASEVVTALAGGGNSGDARMIEGRALAVKASPSKKNAEKFVVGMAALPPGFSTREHSHEAEELAVVVSGSGTIEIESTRYPVARGSILITPSKAPHTTHSAAGSDPLVVLWLYAPPGSEARWLEPDSE